LKCLGTVADFLERGRGVSASNSTSSKHFIESILVTSSKFKKFEGLWQPEK